MAAHARLIRSAAAKTTTSQLRVNILKDVSAITCCMAVAPMVRLQPVDPTEKAADAQQPNSVVALMKLPRPKDRTLKDAPAD